MRYLFLSLVLGLVSCGAAENESQVPKANARVDELRARSDSAKTEAAMLRDPVTGWLVTGGDGMLWTGKYAAVVCGEVQVYAAETEPGRFQRDPDGETSENPNWSDWSRDMGTGLVAYIWRCGNAGMLSRHIAYGLAHKAVANGVPVWKMGEPVGDGRALYTPAFIGRLYQTQLALGGPNEPDRLWPEFYTRGLVDYQAHLQVMNIWHRGEVEEAIRTKNVPQMEKPVEDDAGEGHALVLDVTDDQLALLKDHAERDPRDPLFQAVYGTYTGNMDPAVEACLAPDWYAGEYVRCDDVRKCQLAAWLFACDIVLRRFGA